jgi:hypothetical protein
MRLDTLSFFRNRFTLSLAIITTTCNGGHQKAVVRPQRARSKSKSGKIHRRKSRIRSEGGQIPQDRILREGRFAVGNLWSLPGLTSSMAGANMAAVMLRAAISFEMAFEILCHNRVLVRTVLKAV